MQKKQMLIGAFFISIAAVLWGIDGVVLTPRLFNLNVGFVVLMIHLIPFVFMNLFLFKEYKLVKSFTRTDFIFFFLIALFGGAIGTLSIVKALFLVNFKHLSVVVLLQKLQPVFAISLAAVLLKEKIKKGFVLWAIVAVIASYFLTFGFHLPDFATGSNTIYAALLAILAAFSFGSATVFGKKVLHKYNFSTATFYRFGLTTLIMIIFVFFSGKFGEISSVTSINWLIFVIIALTSGSGAIFMYYYGLKSVKASVSTICELFFPVTAIVLDYFINKNVLSLVQWISAAVLVGAIIKIGFLRTK